MLPDPKLKPAYEKIVWLYVYRDFSKSPADLAAERVSLRLGMTSYPQHLLVDPSTLEILADTTRTVEGFLAAADRTHVRGRGEGSADRIQKAEARAEALEKSGAVPAARKALSDDDIVVRYRAIQILSEKDPKAVAAEAEALLATPNDPFRFEVCRALKKAADPKAARVLETVLAEPKESLNPNVLRIEAAGALGACGDAASVKPSPPSPRPASGGTAAPASRSTRWPRSRSGRRPPEPPRRLRRRLPEARDGGVRARGHRGARPPRPRRAHGRHREEGRLPRRVRREGARAAPEGVVTRAPPDPPRKS